MNTSKMSSQEKSATYLRNQRQRMRRQREAQKDILRQQAEKQYRYIKKVAQGQNIMRYSRWGVKVGQAVVAAGFITALLRPWHGLGLIVIGSLSVATNRYSIQRLQARGRKR